MDYPETVKALTGRPGYTSRVTAKDAESLAAWRAGNNGSGRRPWFVLRTTTEGQQTHNDRSGVIIRYGSYEAAARKAAALNAADPTYVDYWRTKGSEVRTK